MFEMMLRIIFVPMSEKVTGGWTKFCTQGVYNLYSSLNVMAINTHGKMRNAYNILREIPE